MSVNLTAQPEAVDLSRFEVRIAVTHEDCCQVDVRVDGDLCGTICMSPDRAAEFVAIFEGSTQ